MLQNAYLLAKIGADTQPKTREIRQNFAKNWQLPYGSNAGRGSRSETAYVAETEGREQARFSSKWIFAEDGFSQRIFEEDFRGKSCLIKLTL